MFFVHGSGFADVMTIFISMLVSVVSAAAFFDYLGAFCTAYRRASVRLDNERWLLENCKDRTFFSKMQAHTTVCTEVETNARIGAFWAALREVTDLKVVWQPYIVGCVIVILVIVCCSCAYPMAKRRGEIPIHQFSDLT
jgi:hypothetical protein